MRTLFLVLNFLLVFSSLVYSQSLPLLEISDNHRYLQTEKGSPFFWLGDTAWELIHRLTKEEIDHYLQDRKAKGFTVIQTVILAELDGLDTPNAYGNRPLIAHDPTRINEAYFELVDYTIHKAEDYGMYVALLPTWGDKFNIKWGVGPEIFTPENAFIFGQILSKRYKKFNHIIWVLGGDRNPETDVHKEIVRAMAKGILSSDSTKLLTYHPSGANIASQHFDEDWLDLDMFQSGHDSRAKEYEYVLRTTNTAAKRPLINGEARYENIPDRFWEENENDWLDNADVRVSAYWTILAGAAGYTYGCNDVWQMYDFGKTPGIQARTGWKQALHLPGASEMGFMRSFFEAINWQHLEHSPKLVIGEQKQDAFYKIAALSEDERTAVLYTPVGESIEVDVTILKADSVYAYWFNPRNGYLHFIENFDTDSSRTFEPWAKGKGSDFILLLRADRLNKTNFGF